MSSTVKDIAGAGVTGSKNEPQISAGSKAVRRRRRAAVITRWLRKIHLYVGLWGAVLGLLFGVTGILLNHRSILKIPIKASVQNTVQLPVPATPFTDEKQMAAWLVKHLSETMQFSATQDPRIKAEPPKKIIWADVETTQPARWTFNFHGPHKGVNAEYFVGNRFVKLDTIDATPIGTLYRLHMAIGVNVFWVLLSDTIAGGLIVLSITGLLLWSRLNRIKLVAIATTSGALLGGIWFMWSAV